MLCNMDNFFRDILQNHIRRNQDGENEKGSNLSRPDNKPRSGQPSCAQGQGYHAMYLGKVPIQHSSGEDHVGDRVEKLLDICNMNETYIDEVFLDIKPFALFMHYVDITSKIIDTKLFDLARISYCSAGNFEDPRILAWIYRQETEEGFELECHAVRCNTIRKTKTVVYLLHDSITNLFVDMQAALKAFESFSAASKRMHKTNLDISRSTGETRELQKTVRFDDNIQTFNFDIKDDSSSIGDNSVFLSDDPESDDYSHRSGNLVYDTKYNIDDFNRTLRLAPEAYDAFVNNQSQDALQLMVTKDPDQPKHIPSSQKTNHECRKSTFSCTEYLTSPPVSTTAGITFTCVNHVDNNAFEREPSDHLEHQIPPKQGHDIQDLIESSTNLKPQFATHSMAGEDYSDRDLIESKDNRSDTDTGSEVFVFLSEMTMDDVSDFMEKHDFFALQDDLLKEDLSEPEEKDGFLDLHGGLFQDSNSDSGGEDSGSTLVGGEKVSYSYENTCFQDIAL